MNHNLFNDIGMKTNVDMNQIMKLANSLKGANFKDEKTVRRVIAQVAKIANVRVSKEKEEKLVKAILNNKVPNNLAALSKMIQK